VVKQGPPSRVSIPPDFIYSVSVNTKPESLHRQESRLPPRQETPGPQGASTEGHDAQRQVGDLSVYKFYFSSLGWASLFVFATSVLSNSAVGTLQCMIRPPWLLSLPLRLHTWFKLISMWYDSRCLAHPLVSA